MLQTVAALLLAMNSQNVPVAGLEELNNPPAECRLRIPQADDRYSHRNTYAQRLLQLIIQRTDALYGKCTIEEGDKAPANRVVQQLEQDQSYELAWMPVTKDNYQRLHAIPIPLGRGILGWRVLLIRQEDQSLFSKIRSRSQLADYRAGFHELWSDYAVYQHNFGSVVGFRDYQAMLTMLLHNRFDYVSRALHEAQADLQRSGLTAYLKVEDTLLLHYPFADFFFVSQNNPGLASRIERGFQLVQQDGSYEELFEEYYSNEMATLALSQRRIIELENPLFPAEIDTSGPLWITPSSPP